MFNIQFSKCNIQCSMLNSQCSMFNVQYLIYNSQFSILWIFFNTESTEKHRVFFISMFNIQCSIILPIFKFHRKGAETQSYFNNFQCSIFWKFFYHREHGEAQSFFVSIFNIQCSIFNVEVSIFNVQVFLCLVLSSLRGRKPEAIS
jgi:hypothetical protein